MKGLFFGNCQQGQSFIDVIGSGYIDWPGGNESLTVNSSSAWSHRTSDVPSWIDVTSGSGTNGQAFQFFVYENEGSERSCYIRVWLTSDNTVYEDVYIYQAGTV